MVRQNTAIYCGRTTHARTQHAKPLLFMNCTIIPLSHFFKKIYLLFGSLSFNNVFCRQFEANSYEQPACVCVQMLFRVASLRHMFFWSFSNKKIAKTLSVIGGSSTWRSRKCQIDARPLQGRYLPSAMLLCCSLCG